MGDGERCVRGVAQESGNGAMRGGRASVCCCQRQRGSVSLRTLAEEKTCHMIFGLLLSAVGVWIHPMRSLGEDKLCWLLINEVWNLKETDVVI